MPYPSKKFRQNPFTTFSVIRRTDRQTDRSENITSFGGGNNNNQMSSDMKSVPDPKTNLTIQLMTLTLTVQCQMAIEFDALIYCTINQWLVAATSGA